MKRETYWVNCEHTGREPVAYYGSTLRDRLEEEPRNRSDYERVTLKQAREWAALPYTAQAAWRVRAGRRVLEIAGS